MYECIFPSEMLTDVGIVDQLVWLLHGPHAAHHEHVMSALVNLATDNAAVQQDCRRPELQLQTLLKTRLETLAGKEEFMVCWLCVRVLIESSCSINCCNFSKTLLTVSTCKCNIFLSSVTGIRCAVLVGLFNKLRCI